MTQPDQPPQEASQTLQCSVHGEVVPRLRWKKASNKALQLGAYCPKCNEWLKWVPQNRYWLGLAPPAPGGVKKLPKEDRPNPFARTVEPKTTFSPIPTRRDFRIEHPQLREDARPKAPAERLAERPAMPPPAPAADPSPYPKGWDRQRVEKLIEHYENQTEAIAQAEASPAPAPDKLSLIPPATPVWLRKLLWWFFEV
jgi:hypothetical protein